jgi:hypothetical protein
MSLFTAQRKFEMQTQTGYEREKATLDALIKAIQELPHAHASLISVQHPPVSSESKLDATIDLAVADRSVTLLIELKTTVYPRDIREILWQLSRAPNADMYRRTDNVIPLVAAESISMGARELLKAENIGFFDTGGSLFIPAKGAYLYVERPVPKTVEKSIRSFFTGKRSQVLHALLVKHRDWMGVTELSHLAEVSPATASETLKGLERMEWVSSRGHGPSKERQPIDAARLLDEWRTQILASRRPLARRRYYVPGRDSGKLADQLADLCESARVEYALTQEVGAQHYAPFLSSISRVACRMAPGKGADEIVARLDARVVSEGANLDIIETKSRGEFLFKELRGSLWLASPVQVYLDLLRGDGRSRDMAEHLRKEVLGI